MRHRETIEPTRHIEHDDRNYYKVISWNASPEFIHGPWYRRAPPSQWWRIPTMEIFVPGPLKRTKMVALCAATFTGGALMHLMAETRRLHAEG